MQKETNNTRAIHIRQKKRSRKPIRHDLRIMILIIKMPRGGVGVIPMNASDSCLVLPMPRDTKDIGVLTFIVL